MILAGQFAVKDSTQPGLLHFSTRRSHVGVMTGPNLIVYTELKRIPDLDFGSKHPCCPA